MSIFEDWAADPRFAQVGSSAGYLQAAPRFRQKIHDILFKYGTQPTAEQSQLMGGMTVEQNPYSVNQLLRNLQQDSNHSTINTANAAGLEESGAAAAGLNANTENFKHGMSDSAAAEGGELSTSLNDFVDLVNGLFSSAEQAPSPVTAAAPTGGGVGVTDTHVTSSAGMSQPGADIGGAKAAAAARSVAGKLKAPKVTIKGSHGLTAGGGY